MLKQRMGIFTSTNKSLQDANEQSVHRGSSTSREEEDGSSTLRSYPQQWHCSEPLETPPLETEADLTEMKKIKCAQSHVGVTIKSTKL